MATIVKPETILAWCRTLVARKFDGSRQRKTTGRPPVDATLEALVVRLSQENRSWGYDRIVGALQHLGYTISDQTVGNILKRHGMSPAPERQKTTTWNEFIRTHMDVLVATDFLTAEVWTWCGLVTYYTLFFLRIDTREVHLAGVTRHPDQRWMTQIARNMTMADWSVLAPGQYLIHDRDGKYCPAFQQMIEAVGVKQIPIAPRSPNLNAYAERWIRSVKDEALSRLILFGERSFKGCPQRVHRPVSHRTASPGEGQYGPDVLAAPPWRAARSHPMSRAAGWAVEILLPGDRVKRGPNKARRMIVKNRIAGTRITVWDVLHYLETGWSRPEIAATLHLSDAQLDAVARYIEDHKEELMAVHRQIEARKARGNPPEITAKLAQSSRKLQEWLKQHHETNT